MKESTFFHRYKELILGVLMIAFSSFYLYQSTFIKASKRVRVDARMIPQILGVIVLVLGVLQIIAGVKYLLSVKAQNRAEGVPVTFLGKSELCDAVPVILTFVTIGLYVLTFEWLGFIISSTICMFLQMQILTPKGKRRSILFAVVSVVVAVVVYIAFRKGLDLSLPGGVLEGRLPI